MTKLKSNIHVRDFCELTEKDWVSLGSSNMITQFYPFAKGISYQADMALYTQLKTQLAGGALSMSKPPVAETTFVTAVVPTNKKPKRPFSELSKTDYNRLLDLGLLWVCYPEASGNYATDFPPKPKIVEVYLHCDRDTMYNIGDKLGLTGDALKDFENSLHEVQLTLEVNMVNGGIKMLKIDGDNIVRFV